jgi:DegV family protein with EDD domain
MRTAIVTDSTADLPVELVEKHHLSVIPNILVIDGKGYVDGIDISREEFYQRLPAMRTLPTTASASSGSFFNLYQNLLQRGFNKVLSIHAPQSLSGIYNAAFAAAQTFGDQVTIMDSGLLSLGLGFQVLQAAEDAAADVSFETILRNIYHLRQRIHLAAMFNTLEFIRRSGRVSWAKAQIGELLSIKPFIELKDGKVLSLGETRTRQKGINRLLEMILKLEPIEKIAVLHTNAEEDARNLLDRLSLSLDHQPLIVNVTTVIGTHVGPSALGFAVVTRA